MDLRKIKYFIVAAETGSISAASARLHIAQPAVSAQIASLEADLGAPLFIRHARGVELSDAGKVFLEHARKILQDVENARLAIEKRANPFTGEVGIGFPYTLSIVLGVPLVYWVMENMPKVKLRVVEGMSADILDALEKGRVDVAILYEAARSPRIHVKALATEELCLIGDSIPTLAGQEEVRFSVLGSLDLLHTSGAQVLRNLLDNASRQAGVKLKYVAELDSIPQIKHLVASAAGYTILPRASVTADMLGPNTQVLKIIDPVVRIVSFLACSSEAAMSAAAQSIFAALPEVARSLIQAGKWPGSRLVTRKTSSPKQ